MASLREAQERYARHYLALAERAEPHLTGAEQKAWLERLEMEHEHVRAVLRWARDGGAQETGLRLAGSVWRFWAVRGYLSEGRSWLEGLLRPGLVPETWGGAPGVRAKALNGAGNLAQGQGDLARATALLKESLTLYRELGDKQSMAISLNNLGIVAQQQGDLAQATVQYEESLVVFRELGDRRGIAASLNNLGLAAEERGDNAQATALYEESLAQRRELGDTLGSALALGNLGNVVRRQGDLARARALLEESLALERELGEKGGMADLLLDLGTVAQEQGDYARAIVLYEESLALARELGDKWGIAYCLEGLASAVGVPGEAREALARAARLLGAAAALRAAIGAPLPSSERAAYDRTVAAARAALGDEAFAASWAVGQTLTLEQALALALGEPSPA